MPEMPEFPPGSPFEDFFKEFRRNQENNGGGGEGGPSSSLPATSLGSGFIVDADKGLIVTNNHVIRDADEVRVTLHDDTVLDAEIVGKDEKTDLALLKVKTDKHKLTAVSFGNSDTMRVGDWVLAIGNPFGLGGTVTSGIISARKRDINAGPYDDFIQTDASINRGNSGGPMFSLKGEVIGINTAIFSPTGGSVGIGFAIPSNLAKPVIDQLTSMERPVGDGLVFEFKLLRTKLPRVLV
jgi:serine protease Do